jgi:hypothetical protein
LVEVSILNLEKLGSRPGTETEIVTNIFIFLLGVLFMISGMVMGVSVATAYYNLKMRHPTLNIPIIDYDLALLIQPMLMLGISIGVICNVIFPNWLVTILLIVLFLGNH